MWTRLDSILMRNVFRLQDVIVSEERLYLVFEYVDYDLKKLMDLQLGRMPMRDIKVYERLYYLYTISSSLNIFKFSRFLIN